MREMEQKGLLLVLCIHEARNFPRRLGSSLIIEARLNGEVLEADPVPLRGATLGVSTELAWELSKKALHQYKLQRTPIKLQCFSIDVGSETRQLLGYVVLDLRSIQQDKTTAHWYSLLNCSLAGDKPALNVSLVTEEEQALEERDGLKEHEGNSLPPSGQLLLTLNDKGGYYQLGTPSQDDRLYTISVTLANPHSLETVRAQFKSPYCPFPLFSLPLQNLYVMCVSLVH